MSDYEKIKAVNVSTLLELRRSPKHYRHRLTNPRKETDALRLGTAAHVAVLEPDRFLREFVLWESTDPETGKTRQRRGEAWESFQAENAGKKIITSKDYEEAVRYAKAIRGDRTAMQYLVAGEPEVILEWEHEPTGIECKGRIDWHTDIDGKAYLVDLKTARSAAPWAFARDAAKRDYHVRLAWYADAYEKVYGVAPTVVVPVVEKEEPYDVVTYIVPDDVLDVGREVYGELMDTLAACQRENKWPGQGSGEQYLTLPAWAVPSDDTDLDDLGLVGWQESA